MSSERVLLGPGPSLLPPAVVEAMSRPQCGHMDPALVPLLDETVGLLRRVFQTRNELTLPVSGTGTAGMEATLRHLLADEALLVVCTAGYLDLEALWQYWGPLHVYHHTVPVPLVYALHAALRLVVEEGVEARVARHHRHARMLWRGLEALGLELFVPEADRAPTLTTVRVPAGADDERVRARLLHDYGIEIAGGLGQLRGTIWRIGLMGHSSQARHVVLLLGALAQVLAAEGLRVPAAAEVARAALQAER
ncbi:MAG: aminotransferase class V-fold PLP-dependent enzyme [Armatimonadota bacterium]|nr:aminotransferase class V-fold PLP-dependent enzyme [Armatimonadota bacterium]MDR7485698.1 aminotransferase class V-fold PLP-dependent enzyme [Armatimonadota bacterium]MDR7533091.1 aminotransferase class V-fold PLP-dependent enzyme [Armatimonadota bacterium]MDR7535877.1 aminotransferase class V-fold PLP-dependent enzyme [Armatimonadota bacterium]